jgi:ABC-type transporter Mla subunit MlaD
MMNMNNEEFDRRMAFIVEQQAQFASDIQRLQESQARTDQVVAQTAEFLGQMGEVVTRLANVTHAGFTEVNAKINALVDAQIRTEEQLARTDEQLARTDEQLARTDEHLARTDEHLRNFIAVVDRRFNEGRVG